MFLFNKKVGSWLLVDLFTCTFLGEGFSNIKFKSCSLNEKIIYTKKFIVTRQRAPEKTQKQFLEHSKPPHFNFNFSIIFEKAKNKILKLWCGKS